MTTITGAALDAAGAPVVGRTVAARLIAATTALADPGGQIITAAETTTGEGGVWSLELTPLSRLVEPGGAYYVVTVGPERYTITVPDAGTHELSSVLIVPGPLPSTGATAAALAALESEVDAHVADTTGVHGIADTSTLVTAASAIADGSYIRGSGGGRGVEGRTPAEVLADIGALSTQGGSLSGSLTIVDSFTVKSANGSGDPQFRLQPGGTSDVFDIDVAGANVWHSVYDGDDPDGFTGDRYQYMVVRRTADFPSVQMCGRWESRPAPFGPEVHTIHPAEGWAGFGGKNGLSQIRLCGFKATPGAPTSGTWAAGDVILDAAGVWHLCTTGGTPGTWT